MRLWSLHPKYLDQKGLVALWREALLAQKVLQGKTKGYKNHPQLNRFKKYSSEYPEELIGDYLNEIWKEAVKRGYNFDRSKIKLITGHFQIPVTIGQLEYEFKHLQDKLHKRDLNKFRDNKLETNDFRDNFNPHPLFKVIKGDVESWEKVK